MHKYTSIPITSFRNIFDRDRLQLGDPVATDGPRQLKVYTRKLKGTVSTSSRNILEVEEVVTVAGIKEKT